MTQLKLPEALSFLTRGSKPKPFQELTELYRQRLALWPIRTPGGGPRVGIVVTPWQFTATPYFSMECALELARKGAEVTLIFDRSNVFLNAAKASEVEAVASVVRMVEDRLRVIDPAGLPPAEDGATDFLESLLYENAVRQMRGEQAARDFLATHPECEREMTAHAARLRTLLTTEKFDWVLIPGGVWAVSGLYTELARQCGVHFTTFDSGAGALFIAHEGAAAHFADLPQAFGAVMSQTGSREKAAMIGRAWEQVKVRRGGRDVFQLQPPSIGAAACDLLVPLNYRSDTAALFRQRLFGSVTEWLAELLEWLRTQPGVRLAIRQHPCERIPEYRGSDDWKTVLAPFNDLGARFRFIAAEDPVNTYDLLDRAACVLPYTSRVGIEAAMFGKQVILGSHCYYAGCGFAENPPTKAAYFDALMKMLGGGSKASPAAQEAAALTYFLAEFCLMLPTPFTPQPPDFRQWTAIPPHELWATPELQDLTAALLTRIPLATLRQRRLCAS